MLMRTVLVVTLFVTAAEAGIFHDVLAEKVQRFRDIKELQIQLNLVLDEYGQLFDVHTTEVQGLTGNVNLLRQLRSAVQAGARPDELLQAISRIFSKLEGLVDSHPVLATLSRRTYLAFVVLKWMLLGQKSLDDGWEEKLAEIASKFYRLHVHSAVRKGMLEYLHISKSGGTSFSAAAKHSNCSMAPGIGQLEELGDFPRWINGTAFEEITGGTDVMWSYYSTKGRPIEGQTCTRRRAYLQKFGYNYVSNEFTLHGGSSERNTHVCPQMFNVVTLRDPASRLASHLHYMLARVKKRLMGKKGLDEGKFFDIFCAGDVNVWERMAPTVIDNYNVRSFIGESGFHMPVGDIGREDVEVARRLLLQFDLVLDLDAGSEAVDLAIQQGLGWNLSMFELHVRSSSSALSKLNYSKEDCPNHELLQTLRTRQNPDRVLYSTGRTLALLDGVFLGMARALGLRPGELAAKEAPAGVSAPGDEPGCGLMRPAAAAVVEGARWGEAAAARGDGAKASRNFVT
ncbi:hypothetical protein Vafri_5021 [Volvox africanus]|uniref:Sulfotransferase n=1 Tax=Volvox africanus TaxID=51714 RepID=A0A8J4AVK7_9CHLO|nr:hypothetical protein Vafri_5021 [Volvox africanus]